MRLHKFSILLCLCLLPLLPLNAQSGTMRDWGNDAREITKGCSSQHQQAQAIYRWICNNIAYDVSYRVYTADECWKSRKGVCEAYCELFYQLASAVGLKVEVVKGKAKLANGTIDERGHAWLIVYADGCRFFVDPTWGAGSVDDGLFTRRPTDAWFDVEPRLMAFTHLPNDPSRQLLEQPVDEYTFLKLPPVQAYAAEYGVDVESLYNYILKHHDDGCVQFTPGGGRSMQIVSVPYARYLHVGRYYDFKFRVADPSAQLAIVEDEELLGDAFRRRGDTMSARVMPSREGLLAVAAQSDDDASLFVGYILYEVLPPTADELERLHAAVRQREDADPLSAAALRSVTNFDETLLRRYSVDGSRILAAVRDGSCTSLPVLYGGYGFDLDLVDFPLSATLQPDRQYSLSIVPRAAGRWAVVVGDQWIHAWTAVDGSSTYTTSFVPKSGSMVKLAFQPQGETQYRVCLSYQVK